MVNKVHWLPWVADDSLLDFQLENWATTLFAERNMEVTNGWLELEDGTRFPGFIFGAKTSVPGEVGRYVNATKMHGHVLMLKLKIAHLKSDHAGSIILFIG